MKSVLLHSYQKSKDWYSSLYDKITEDEVQWWESRFSEKAYNPPEKQLNELREIIDKKTNKIHSDEEIRNANKALYLYFSLATKCGVRKYRDSEKCKRIKEWIDRDKAIDERILKAVPLKGMICPVCKKRMKYKWSDLHSEGTIIEPKESVIFFYECPNICKRKIYFENGEPWISKSNNDCPICKGERKIIITKDIRDTMYFVYECLKCNSKEVKRENDI